jgi:hypothetical protein
VSRRYRHSNSRILPSCIHIGGSAFLTVWHFAAHTKPLLRKARFSVKWITSGFLVIRPVSMPAGTSLPQADFSVRILVSGRSPFGL